VVSKLDSGKYHRVHADPAIAANPDWLGGQMAVEIGGVVICTDDSDPGAEDRKIPDLNSVGCLDIAPRHVAGIRSSPQADFQGGGHAGCEVNRPRDTGVDPQQMLEKQVLNVKRRFHVLRNPQDSPDQSPQCFHRRSVGLSRVIQVPTVISFVAQSASHARENQSRSAEGRLPEIRMSA
jgi:hypothetical protein